MQFDWWSFALQAVNFLVLVWLLQRFLYRPAKAVIERRKQLAEQAFVDAATKKGEAEAARQRFEADRIALADERREMLADLHRELETERDQVMRDARAEAGRIVDAAREEIAGERDEALAAVRDQTAELAVELASDLLRKTIGGSSNGMFLDRIEQEFRGLPEEQRASLRQDLLAPDARLTVVTATPLGPEDRRRWIEWSGACFGHGNQPEFADDPALVGGVEVRFPHAVLKFTWADQLKKARELLTGNETDS